MVFSWGSYFEVVVEIAECGISYPINRLAITRWVFHNIQLALMVLVVLVLVPVLVLSSSEVCEVMSRGRGHSSQNHQVRYLASK
jgi:hypothetical protein